MFFRTKIIYIVESIAWVVNREGKCISRNIKNLYGVPIKVLRAKKVLIRLFKNKVLHFGSRNVYLPYNYSYVNKNNNIILTWYHGTDKDIEYIRLLPKVTKRIDIIHTSCTINKEKLIQWGAEEKKIVIIPIGIDVNLFKKKCSIDKKSIRKEIGIPESAICIGSFQKDGHGWGEGDRPKLIKGPDIFCDVIQRLKDKYPVYVLLIGPARGYIKKRLALMGVPYKHLYLKNYLDVPKYFIALDLYIISSRVEGGPKAIMECSASRIPVVSTDVGMVHDIARHEYNALISKIEDTEDLVHNCGRVIDDNSLREKIISNAYRSVDKLDWKFIAEKYYTDIYSNFL